MAEKDVTIKPEIKENLEQIEKVGQTLINLANLRQLFEDGNKEIVNLTVQQLFDFGCTIDAGVDSIYHHLDEARPETDPLKPLAGFVTKPKPAAPADRPVSILEEVARAEAESEKKFHTCFTLDQVDAINLKLFELSTLVSVMVAASTSRNHFDEAGFAYLLEDKFADFYDTYKEAIGSDRRYQRGDCR
jgi:hypothetical protein